MYKYKILMKSFIQKNWPMTVAIGITFMGLIFVALEPYSSELLDFRRQPILDGEIWRLLTCNFHHTNLNHLLLNAAGLIMVTLIHEHHYKKYTQLILIGGVGFVVGITLLIFNPETVAYAGLSGALHGLIAWGIVADIRKGDKTGYLLLIGLIAKLLSEQFYGPLASTEALIGGAVLINGHLYGAIWGALFAFVLKPTENMPRKRGLKDKSLK